MYIVTGGAGFIGSALIWHLNNLGIDDILVVDHLSGDSGESEKWRNLRALRFSDYLERDEFRELLAAGAFEDFPLDGIYHLGACSATTEKDAGYLVDNNYRFSCELADFAAANQVRLVYASSCATYGDGSSGYNDDEETIEKLRPLNMYGYSKQMFDLYVKRHYRYQNMVGCKFSNIFGPNEVHKGAMRSLVCKAFAEIAAKGRICLFKSYLDEYADGEQKRDFLYVKDAVKMVAQLMNSTQDGIYNIGSGKAESWNNLAGAVFKAMGKRPQIEYIEMPDELRGKYQYYTKCEMNKWKNWKFDFTLEEAVADYFGYWSSGKFLGDD